MSRDLGLALHAAVDDGPDDAPLDLDRLTARITRSRRIRATLRAGSAVGAAALVALAVAGVASRTPTDAERTVLVACGSPVSQLSLEAAPPIAVARGTATDFDNEPAPPPPLGSSLGRVDAGSATSVQVVTTITDAELAALPESAVDEAHRMLVRWRTTLAAEQAQQVVDVAAVRMTQASIAWLEPTIRHLDEVRERPPVRTRHPAGEVLLAQDGRVVAMLPVPALTADALLNPDRAATTEVPLDLRGCTDGARALSPGDYQVYATDPGGGRPGGGRSVDAHGALSAPSRVSWTVNTWSSAVRRSTLSSRSLSMTSCSVPPWVRTFFRVPTSSPRPVESMNVTARRSITRSVRSRSRTLDSSSRRPSALDTSISPATSTTVRGPTSRLVTRMSTNPSLGTHSNRSGDQVRTADDEPHLLAGSHLAEQVEGAAADHGEHRVAARDRVVDAEDDRLPVGRDLHRAGTSPADGSSRSSRRRDRCAPRGAAPRGSSLA